MAKKSKRAQGKYIQMGAELKASRRNALIELIASVVIGAALWAWVSFSGINDHSITMSVVIFGATVILVFGIGIIGNRFSSYNTDLQKLKREYGVTDEDIKNWRANH